MMDGDGSEPAEEVASLPSGTLVYTNAIVEEGTLVYTANQQETGTEQTLGYSGVGNQEHQQHQETQSDGTLMYVHEAEPQSPQNGGMPVERDDDLGLVEDIV